MKETWKPIPEWSGLYEVSNTGKVRSLRSNPPKLLKTPVNKAGYRVMNLCLNGRQKTIPVHEAVLMAFSGNRPVGYIARHLDDDKLNNHVDNLAWGTYSDNAFDAVRNGKHGMSSKSHCKRGHEFTEENTRLRKGNRWCRKCQRLRYAIMVMNNSRPHRHGGKAL